MSVPIDIDMGESTEARIEQALARIEAAAGARSAAASRLAARHARLRSRIEVAIASLDELIARESPSEAE